MPTARTGLAAVVMNGKIYTFGGFNGLNDVGNVEVYDPLTDTWSPQPTIAQTPMSGPPGTSFVQSGAGFTPNSTATLHFRKPDGSEYPTMRIQLDPSGHFEITYTAPWNKEPGTYSWWAIDDATGGKSNEVSYVIEGVTGELDHLKVSKDGNHTFPNQKVNVAFQVRIQAEDYAKNSVASFNGKVYLSLSGSAGLINPNQVTLANGEKTFKVAINEPSQATHIHAQSGAIYGDSNDFAVEAPVQVFGSIRSHVYDSSGQNVALLQGATVNLSDLFSDNIVQTTQSGDNGVFEFLQVPPGSYNVWATYNDRQSSKHRVTVSEGETSQPGSLLVRSKKRPVIFVPGFMGTTVKSYIGAYPTLPTQYPASQDDLKLYNDIDLGPVHYEEVGWSTLWNALKDRYEIYACPYDWRVYLGKTKDTYQKYLVPVINQARLYTGWDKVDVVAHSMGGLLVRSYIQSEDFNHDIDKFAMVGTPNHGSLNAYYLWEGGDPKTLDEEAKSFPRYLYSVVADLNYMELMGGQEMFYWVWDNGPIWWRISKERARGFFHLFVSSVNQLMPTFDNCLSGSNTKIDDNKTRNDWLIKLNKDPNKKRIKPGPNEEVKTKIFGANKEKTIKQIKVKPSTDNNLYEDGEPSGEPAIEEAGDGTVLWKESAIFEDIDHIDELNMPPKDRGQHKSLIRRLTPAIAEFLDRDRTFATITGSRALKGAGPPPTVLGMSIRGRAAPLIIEPAGTKCGIDDGNQTVYDSPGACDIIRDPSGGGIRLVNPSNGAFAVTLTGKSVGEVFVTLSFLGEGITYETKVALFYPGQAVSFSFQLDSAAKRPINIQEHPPRPQNLKAVPMTVSGVKKTKLTWAPVAEPGPAGYRVYTRKEGEPLLKMVKTVAASATQYATSYPWENPVRVFAISAIDNAGAESFLSTFVTNQTATVADFSASNVKGKPPLKVKFHDASVGNPTNWLWDFGDGTTSTEKNPVHIYEKTGIYTVSLTIQGPEGSDLVIKLNYVLVNSSPSVEPPAGPSHGKVNKSYTFTVKATDPDGDSLQYRFDWGDGVKSSWRPKSSAAHKWVKANTYCVKAQAKDDKGALSGWSKCANITIE